MVLENTVSLFSANSMQIRVQLDQPKSIVIFTIVNKKGEVKQTLHLESLKEGLGELYPFIQLSSGCSVQVYLQ